MATSTEIRKGMGIRYNNDVCIVLDFQHRTPGNLRGFVQATIRSIRTGKSQNVRFSTSEKIDVVPMMREDLEYSYKDGEDYVFTDLNTFDTHTLNKEVVGDSINYLVENTMCTVLFIEGTAAQIELPPNVVLNVVNAPEGVKGDSTSNVMKTITLETGIDVQAPLFIKLGEKIKIDTKTGKYMERVNK
ncbi:elongation factor P [Verrucomicrobia bacterium]|nr:elongation factor P [Verrucomicrobiota bacterium]